MWQDLMRKLHIKSKNIEIMNWLSLYKKAVCVTETNENEEKLKRALSQKTVKMLLQQKKSWKSDSIIM